MKSTSLAIAAVFALTLAAPAEAGHRKFGVFKQQQIVWAPLFLGIGY